MPKPPTTVSAYLGDAVARVPVDRYVAMLRRMGKRSDGAGAAPSARPRARAASKARPRA